MKKYILILIFFSSIAFSQGFKLGEAKGMFLSIGIGPKLPIGTFSVSNDLGIGFDVTASYTDNQFLPVFFFTKIAYQTFPGAVKRYKTTDYASFTTNLFSIMPGLKFYFPPIITDEILIMPIAEIGPSLGFFNNSHIYKASSGISNKDETLTKFGFHIGGGFSMFFLEGVINYYFYPENHSISLDLRIQIPVFAKI